MTTLFYFDPSGRLCAAVELNHAGDARRRARQALRKDLLRRGLLSTTERLQIEPADTHYERQHFSNREVWRTVKAFGDD